MLKKDGILLNLRKERQMLMLFSSRILLCWHIPMMLAILYTQKDLRFFWKTLFLERLFLFFFGFWSWLKDRISLSERLVFFILKDFQLIQKDLLFLILKDIFLIRKTWMLKKDMSFLQKDMNFYFQKDWLL